MDFFLGEIRLFPMRFAPEGWAVCDGALMSVRENQALFSLLGNRYGGDGKKDFALPDLRGRVAIGMTTNPKRLPPNVSTTYAQGARGGEQQVALTEAMLPPHLHTLGVSTVSATTASLSSQPLYADVIGSQPTYAKTPRADDLVPLSTRTISHSGAGGPHDNMQPSLALNFCIALRGDYPPRQD